MLPTVIPYSKMRSPDEVTIAPGSFWRLTDEGHDLAQKPSPDHGLILLVSEARVIDGDLHTIVLEFHPLWGTGQIKILLEEFLTSFAPEPNGADLREEEINALMNSVNAIGREMQSPPDGAILIEKERQTEKDADSVCSVPSSPSPEQDTQLPSVLLPSRDVLAAQEAIEGKIAAIKAQQNWIESKTNEMTSAMHLVATYQKEKVALSLAGISEQTAHAEHLLKSVQTMRLFLGEEIKLTQLLDGEGADPSVPLSFMQRMLYLDEEIYVSHLLDGLEWKDMGNLSQMFAQDFSLVERMLPYERCVAITRVRRNSDTGNTSVPTTWAGVFAAVEAMKNNERIFIFVRDGKRVHMIEADQATSQAKRLFPSKSEIDNLFVERRSSEARAITPSDIEYTDARAMHDTRALFYKRFLIMFWGLSEREGIFGPFVPKGENWLEQSIHSDRFNFVHDEENGLRDDRIVLSQFIRQANSGIGPGSRIAVQWQRACDSTTAPAICSHDKNYRTIFEADPLNEFEIAQVTRKGVDLVVHAQVKKFSMSSGQDRVFATPVKIFYPVDPSYTSKLNDRDLAEGILCLDNITSKDVGYYIESRAARYQYLNYLHLFHAAYEHLLSEEEIEGKIVAKLLETSRHPEHVSAALKTWRGAKKWTWPEPKQYAAIHAVAAQIAKVTDEMTPQQEVINLSVRGNGDIVVQKAFAAQPLPEGMELPWVEEQTFGKSLTKAKKTVIADLQRSHLPGQYLCAQNAESFAQAIALHKSAPPGLVDVANKSAFDLIPQQGEVLSEIERLLAGENNTLLQGMLGHVFIKMKRQGDRRLSFPRFVATLGLVIGHDRLGNNSAWQVRIILDARSMACNLGLVETYLDLAAQVVEDPVRSAEASRDRRMFEVSIKKLDNQSPLKSSFEEGLVLTHDWRNAHGITTHDEKDRLLTLREMVARPFAKRISSGWDAPIDPANMQAKANALRVHGPSDLEGFLARLLTKHG